MLRTTLSGTLRAAAILVVAAVLVFHGQASNASPSHTVFAFSGGGGFNTVLQINGATNIPATSRGWYRSVGTANAASATSNYIVGLCGTDACGEPDNLYHDYFVFAIPVGIVITSAALLLDVPAGNGFISPSAAETYTVYDVTTPIGSLGTDSVATYTDLGSGTVYGSRNYTAADKGTTTTVPLNPAALAFLNAHLGQTIAFGGALQTPDLNIPVLDSWPLLAAMALVLLVLGGVALRYRRS
jgi:hypothetical protein